MNHRTRAVVLGRNYTSRLGMIRAAGEAGCEVIVIKTEKNTGYKKCKIDQSSKYVKGYYCAPQPDQEGLIQTLLDIKDDKEKAVLLPTDDYTASTIDFHFDRLSEFYLAPGIADKRGQIIQYMDKNVQKQMARECGLNVPDGWTAHFHDGAYHYPDKVTFPCFIKPQVSLNGIKGVMSKCKSKEELDDRLKKCAAHTNGDVLIEQYIDIEKEYDIPGFTDGEKVIIPGVIEKGYIHLGVTATGTIRQSRTMEYIAERITKFIQRLGFVGLIDIELYESKGIVYFNELNLRFGASGYAATKSFGNLPKLLINCLSDKKLDLTEINESFATKTFASEKVCLQLFSHGKLSWKEFKQTITSADFCFVNNEDDPMPYRHFCKDARVARAKMAVKKLARK